MAEFIVGDLFGPQKPKGDINVVVNDARSAIAAAGRLRDQIRAADQAATQRLADLLGGTAPGGVVGPVATLPSDPSITQGAANLVAPGAAAPSTSPTAEQLAAVEQLAALLNITPTWRADP